ncbi:hypothetical protein R70723_26595 [Paenibacillus sp. FSL R7-0273]|uniref:hypothetical protein n=1 Tax=Paenibacillus sp. FSL R7-0273 TaxID=1536772 RepID=UPI0004F58DF3|nr:hypothetical protein [Paenibacillus sp. FSL R7-0273]AIQ49075.1 hypothetical protein R70723_26595 [Paenibacillus sp. FSL R7-0273]
MAASDREPGGCLGCLRDRASKAIGDLRTGLGWAADRQGTSGRAGCSPGQTPCGRDRTAGRAARADNLRAG